MVGIGSVGRAGIGSVCRACKTLLLKRRNPEKKSSLNDEQAPDNLKPIRTVYNAENEKIANSMQNSLHFGNGPPDEPPSLLRASLKQRFMKTYPVPSSPSAHSIGVSTNKTTAAGSFSCRLDRSLSHSSQTPARLGSAKIQRSLSHKTTRSPAHSGLLGRGSTSILYSNSNGLLKPPSLEMELECTLEELCFGCVKEINIMRDVVKDGQLTESGEVLMIKVKPGWRKGTKITFKGMGNETPGLLPSDITFTVSEKQHELFKREGDDLELVTKVPLVDALTGCTLLVPLLGGEQMSLTTEDIITPDYKRVILGQGMPLTKEPGKRGNLRIKFLLEFPEELTDIQKSDVYRILQDY